MIDGDKTVEDEVNRIKKMLRQGEELEQPSDILKESKLIATKGEIVAGIVKSNVLEVEHQGERKVIDLVGSKTSFTELLGEDIVKTENKELEQQETVKVEIPKDVEKAASIDEIVEETPIEIELEEQTSDRLEDILEDEEKNKIIMKILNSKPKKVPENPERLPQKVNMPEQEVKKIPEKHISKFETLINFISQIFKVIKK